MREGFGVGKIVDRYEFDLRIVERGADDIAAYAAEAVNTYFHGHGSGESPSDVTLLVFRGEISGYHWVSIQDRGPPRFG